jgi:hypothetical protein
MANFITMATGYGFQIKIEAYFAGIGWFLKNFSAKRWGAADVYRMHAVDPTGKHGTWRIKKPPHPKTTSLFGLFTRAP